MGCPIKYEINRYKKINKKFRELNPKVESVRLQHAINDYWLGLENNVMTESEKQVYKKLVEQTDGLALIGLGGNAQLNEPLVVVKEVGNEYTVHLESGKNYTFIRGMIKSEPTAKGQSVTMESMVLTDPKQIMHQQNGTKGEFDKELDKKLREILQKLYPEIKLEYTEQQILHGEGVMNQEVVDSTVKLSLKVVEALVDWSTVKPSKHGGKSAPVLETIRTKQEAGVRKRLAGKGVPKEQIDFVFEYMRQNDIGEMKTSELAERVLMGLVTEVTVSTTKDYRVIDQLDSSTGRMKQVSHEVNSKYYENLTVPGGTNYQEKEIATPSLAAPKKGHADFATDKGIGWYRVDDSVEQDGTLRVLEMQSDMFQKMKDEKLNSGEHLVDPAFAYELATDTLATSTRDSVDYFTRTNPDQVVVKDEGIYIDIGFKADVLDKSFLQLLNTDNKWVKFFIQSIVQDSQKKGYEKIRFPAGETAARVEGHESIAEQIAEVDSKISSIESNYDKLVKEYTDSPLEKTEETTYSYGGPNIPIPRTIAHPDSELKKLREQKQELKTDGIEKLAPIEGFYQVRVRNTLIKTYGKDNVKTVTDEHGNQWFELALDSKRDNNIIMLQQQGNEIKGQADIEAKTVLISSLLQSQDTLPHEYAHHYIRMFIDAPIVKEAIKKWGSEEALVQAIGEQVVEQKGEAYGWWKKFTAMLQKWFDTNFSKADKEDIKNMLTDAFLERKDLANKMGSDPDTAIGETEADKFLGQETLDLGEVLAEEFNIYYSADVQEGRQIQTQEFADLQNTVVKTYQETMKALGTGELNLRMFENMQDKTAGEIDLRTNEMQIRWNKMSRLTRVSEVFLHEINHKMSSHVFAKNMNLRRLMEDLRDSAIRSGITYELFLEGIDKPTQEEIEIAKMKFEYTFDKTANVEEFYAYATTNEQVYNAIKKIKIDTPLVKYLEMDPKKKSPMKKVLNTLIKTVNKVWRLLSGRRVVGGKMIADMVATIAKVDAEQEQAKWQAEAEQEGISNYAKTKINQLDETLKPVTDKVEEWSEKASAKNGAKWMAKHIAKIPVLNELMETGISQYLWRAVTQDTTTAEVADMYMIFRHSKQVVEKHTADIRNGVKAVANEWYKDVDKQTKDAMTKIVLEGDLAQFGAKEIKEYLADGTRIDAEIKRLEELVYGNDPLTPVANKKDQIDGLAEYLVSGKTTVHNQQVNANNIAANLIGDKAGKPSKTMVANINKLVSLKVLQKSDPVQLERLNEMGTELLQKTITMYRGYIDDMREDAVVGVYDPVPKGYTRPADGLLKYELIPEEELEAQKSVMMKQIGDKPHVVVEGKKYYLMTGRTKSVGFNEGALGLISHTTEGIPVSQLIRKNNELKGALGIADGELRNKTKSIIKAIDKQDKDILRKFGLIAGQSMVPVYNHQNELVDYRIQLTKLEKEVNLPDREIELEDILSNTFSRSIKTSLTAMENKKVVDTIIENSARGVLENPEEYVLVEEYTEEDKQNGVKREKRHDRWEYLPDHTKDYIFKKTQNKGLLIHKDFVELMTGEKDVTIGNFAKYGFDIKKYPVARARLVALEAYITEILGYVKQAMVVLNADILVGNQVSNATVAMAHGIDPIRYSKKFKQRWQQLNDYNEKVQMLAELEVKKMAGEKVDNKIKQLNKQLEGNIWDELVKDGQYTTLVEDINVEAKMDGQLMQQMNKAIDDSKFADIIKTAKNMLYINRTTPLYNTMLKTVHYGDAITRQIIKEELEEKAIKRDGKVTDKTEREILNYLDQLLVNYGYTMNRWAKYSEKVGGLFFMRYYMGQAKALMSMTKKNPTRMGLLQVAQEVSGLDIADPLDTYTNSGIDGIAHRWMLDDAVGLIIEPNIFDLVPDMSSAFVIR